MKSRIPIHQFVRFLAAGGFAALANFGSRFVFSMFVSFEIAVVCAFFVGMATGYLLFRTYVFQGSTNAVHEQIGYYVLLNLLGLAQTYLVSVYGARWLTPYLGLELGQAAAHMAGISLPVVTSFFGHKYFTFRARKADGNR